MSSEVSIHSLANGLTVLVEPMTDFESVAWALQIPGGIAYDAPNRVGAALLLSELTTRGAGGLSSREISNAFDEKGIRHGEGVGHEHFSYRGTCLSQHLPEVIRLTSLMVREPTLPEDEVDSIRSVLLQDIAAQRDNPVRRTQVKLAERYYPAPFNRPGIGTVEGIEPVSIEELRRMHAQAFCAKGCILSVAGSCSVEQVLREVELRFGSWSGAALERLPFGAIQPFSRYHEQEDAAQLQIMLAYPSAPFGSPHYYAAKVAVQVLSGGMFGRLFVEVREKRGLVYSVYASHVGQREYGTITAYAGTTPDRAHETFDVLLGELSRLKGTVTEGELVRAKVNLKSSLVLGQEGPGSRAGSNGHEYWLDGRVRSLEEIIGAIEGVDIAAVDACLEAYPPKEFSMVTLGARDLSTEPS